MNGLLAVAFQANPAVGDLEPRWNGLHVHSHAKAFLDQGRLIPIAGMLTTEDFRGHDSNVTYPQAGSFAHFLIETYGLEKYLAQYSGSSPTESADRIGSRFGSSYGFGYEEAERQWLEFLAGWTR